MSTPFASGDQDPADGPIKESAKAAVREVGAGTPGPLSRPWLAGISLTALALFILDSVLVGGGGTLGFDRPVAVFVQQIPWGPLTYLMRATNWLGGSYQIIAGVAVIVVVFLLERRAGWLMAIGSAVSYFDNALKALFARQRPTADLVHIVTPAPGYSYPSGHAVFFTWLYFMVALSLAPHLSRRVRPFLWVATVFLIAMACIARVWAGAHWPSDVLGGLLLALSWAAFVLWVPERWLPYPTSRWLRWRRPQSVT